MTRRVSASMLGTLVVALLAPSGFATDPVFDKSEVVIFESEPYTYPLSPFKVKQAKKKGITLEPKTEPGVRLKGYLTRPEGTGPFPAVVLMHGCAGIGKWDEAWADRLVSWGYVVLSVDSYTPRGEKYMCGRQIITPWHRALDAFGAKGYLSSRPFVDSARIAVMGMSRGGNGVLYVVKESTSEDLKSKPFRAAVALYPWCGEPEPIGTPTLILTGSEDTWTPAERCVRYSGGMKSRQLTLEVLPGAYHAFDHPGIDIEELGHIVRSDPVAAAQAIQMTREFLMKAM